MVVMELEGGQQLAKFADGGGKGSKIVKVCQCLKWMGPNSFHFSSNLQTKVPNHNSDHYSPKEKMLLLVSWHIFFS